MVNLKPSFVILNEAILRVFLEITFFGLAHCAEKEVQK